MAVIILSQAGVGEKQKRRAGGSVQFDE